MTRTQAKIQPKTEPKVVHATCVVERSFAQSPAAVFTALSDPAKIREWMAGGEHSKLIDFHCDFREGGRQFLKYSMGPQTPVAGAVITSEGQFQHILPNQRIVTASTLRMGERIFSASLVTFELLPAAAGCDLVLTHQGAFFEGSDGPALREQGWNRLADNLVSVVNRP